MNQIKFSHNWNNKLNNNIFTTIRKYTPEKYKYYLDLKSYDFDVILNGKKFKEVKLVGIEIKKFKDIPSEVLILDTGILSIIDIEKVFYKFGLNTIQDEMIILIFKNDNKPT